MLAWWHTCLMACFWQIKSHFDKNFIWQKKSWQRNIILTRKCLFDKRKCHFVKKIILIIKYHFDKKMSLWTKNVIFIEKCHYHFEKTNYILTKNRFDKNVILTMKCYFAKKCHFNWKMLFWRLKSFWKYTSFWP